MCRLTSWHHVKVTFKSATAILLLPLETLCTADGASTRCQLATTSTTSTPKPAMR